MEKNKHIYNNINKLPASPLENELMAFIEAHPETFSPQDVVNLRRRHC